MSEVEAVEYRPPIGSRIGDVFLLLLLLPVGTLGLAFLLVIPTVVLSSGLHRLGFGELAPASIFWIAGGGAAVLFGAFAFFTRPWAVWRIRLEPQHVVLSGLGWPALIRYEDVEFLQASPQDRLRNAGAVWLKVNTRRRRRRILLDRDGAPLCLSNLRARCHRAAAIDLQGRDYLPSDVGARTQGARRLARYWVVSTVLFLPLGLAAGPLAVARLTDTWPADHSLRTSTRELSDRTKALYLLLFAPAMVGWGLFSLRQARKHLRESSTPLDQGFDDTRSSFEVRGSKSGPSS